MNLVPLFGIARLLARPVAPGTGGREAGDNSRAYQLVTAPSPDQDPVYDFDSGVAKSVTAAQFVFTPTDAHKFVEVYAKSDVWVRADGKDAAVPVADAAGGKPVFVGAGQTKVISVIPEKDVSVVSASSAAALVVVTPMVARS